MPYREDLDAALAHADAAQRQLEEARKENEADHARIAELEEQLAAAKRGVHETKQRDARTERRVLRGERQHPVLGLRATCGG